MNKIILLPILLVLLTVAVLAENTCNLDVSLINQDPYPATPDSYVKLVFQVSGAYNTDCKGVRFQLIPLYPFSLDQNDTQRNLEESTTVSGYKQDWMVAYKIKVDKDAVEGENQIEAYYGPGYVDTESYINKNEKFNITIQDSRTSFDAVIQEVSGSDVSIAIANVGKYTANAVVVRIPDQDSFRATGTNGQMVGNLVSGDYTIVGFSITPNVIPNTKNISRRNINITSFQGQSNKLKFDIYYTDNIGERRIVNMELPLNMNAGNFSSTARNFAGRNQQNSSSIWSNKYTYLTALALLAALLILYKKRAKAKNLFRKKDTHDPNKNPDWIKNTKDKEKER